MNSFVNSEAIILGKYTRPQFARKELTAFLEWSGQDVIAFGQKSWDTYRVNNSLYF